MYSIPVFPLMCGLEGKMWHHQTSCSSCLLNSNFPRLLNPSLRIYKLYKQVYKLNGPNKLNFIFLKILLFYSIIVLSVCLFMFLFYPINVNKPDFFVRPHKPGRIKDVATKKSNLKFEVT